MALPAKFISRMRDLLGDDYVKFESALSEDTFRAIRINTLKTDVETVNGILGFLDKPTAFCETSYYLPESFVKPGNHPLHHAGAYYVQEPSASSVVEVLGIEPGDRVLDLCAAPGGKTTQAAAALEGRGLLVSNEYVRSRVQPLISNIERMGITNAAVFSSRPDDLTSCFPSFFDKVIADAPCSGEGMFRKDSEAVSNWSVENVLACAERQLKILDSAAYSVADGGKLVYSTCTYSYEENEDVVLRFLSTHPEFHLIPIKRQFGCPAFVRENNPDISLARRIFNFHGGEGHFVALMQKEGESTEREYKNSVKFSQNKVFEEFFRSTFEGDAPVNTVTVGDRVYIANELPDCAKAGLIRNGIYAGNVVKNRFVPEHALFASGKYRALSTLELSADDSRTSAFLHGEEIECDDSNSGYTAVTLHGIPLGFGKATGGKLKNHYPKGIRIL